VWPRGIAASEFVDHWKLPKGREQQFMVAVEEVDRAQVLVFDLREANGEAVA
jgi:hypothetical protein